MYNSKYNYCNNCGRIGHTYKKCLESITSLGLIAFKIDYENLNKHLKSNLTLDLFKNINLDQNVNIIKYNTKYINLIEKNCELKKYIKFLLISRKSSLGFMELMRGHYDTTIKETVVDLYKQMYIEEIVKITNNSFDELWMDIWQIDTIEIDKEYSNSKKKYIILKENGIFDYCNSNIKPNVDLYEWGFPKGRRTSMEKNIDTANREFIEETNLKHTDFSILHNISSITENLVGTNNIKYKHIYYFAQCDNNINVAIDFNNKLQYKEVGNIGWYSYDESINMIRDYHIDKKIILNNIFIFICNIIINNK